MSEYDISIGQGLQEKLCDGCKERLTARLTAWDIIKGTKDLNHLIKIFDKVLCKSCKDKVMAEAIKK